jgi:hypothetical protein
MQALYTTAGLGGTRRRSLGTIVSRCFTPTAGALAVLIGESSTAIAAKHVLGEERVLVVVWPRKHAVTMERASRAWVQNAVVADRNTRKQSKGWKQLWTRQKGKV